jgi:hypothetical protein
LFLFLLFLFLYYYHHHTATVIVLGGDNGSVVLKRAMAQAVSHQPLISEAQF